MGNRITRETEDERGFGVIIHESAKTIKTQSTEAAAKANKILGLIRRTVVSRYKNIILDLYKALVRPHLEYHV